MPDSIVPAPKLTVLGIVAKDGMAYLLYERDDDPMKCHLSLNKPAPKKIPALKRHSHQFRQAFDREIAGVGLEPLP